MTHVVIIGAGFGGLAAAAELAKAGFDVSILEAHTYPGGCAGTFYHKGFLFDAGATLAGGFGVNAPMTQIGERFSVNWGVRPTSQAMVVHLSDGSSITRWSDSACWAAERIEVFGEASARFWDWQERSADLLWDLATRLPAWPPQDGKDLRNLMDKGIGWIVDNLSVNSLREIPSLLLDSSRTVDYYLNGSSNRMRQFVDAQLLIASQTTSKRANALYGAVALDLPRQGVVEVPGGIGFLARKLLESVEQYGGRIQFRTEAVHISRNSDAVYFVHTKRKEIFPADILIFNLPPWNIKNLSTDLALKKIDSLSSLPDDAWGAFTMYVGIENDLFPVDFAVHHQMVIAEPLGEGNSIFLSLSPKWDHTRAPEGYRALTISTHTNLHDWWKLLEMDRLSYEHQKHLYIEKILGNIERILPGIRDSIKLILSGTPVTFQHFTRRRRGWVGGYPQTGLFRVWGPKLGRNLWMVGDSIFPGQSIPAVSMGGIRVAKAILADYQTKRTFSFSGKV